MDEVARRRARKDNDCKKWSPLDALEDMVERIKLGKIAPTMIAMHWLEKDDDGNTLGSCCAQLSYTDHIALLNLALAQAIEDWKL